jgi:hypothetical protein
MSSFFLFCFLEIGLKLGEKDIKKHSLNIFALLMLQYVLRFLEILKHSWIIYCGIIYFFKVTHTWLYFLHIGFCGFIFHKKYLCLVRIHPALNEEIPKAHNEYGIIAIVCALIKVNYFYMPFI